jgi:hypothetical protein
MLARRTKFRRRKVAESPWSARQSPSRRAHCFLRRLQCKSGFIYSPLIRDTSDRRRRRDGGQASDHRPAPPGPAKPRHSRSADDASAGAPLTSGSTVVERTHFASYWRAVVRQSSEFYGRTRLDDRCRGGADYRSARRHWFAWLPAWQNTAISLALCGATIGFAFFNRPVAKLFLGDVGSLPIALILGWQLLTLAGNGARGRDVVATVLSCRQHYYSPKQDGKSRSDLAGTSFAFLSTRHRSRLSGHRCDRPSLCRKSHSRRAGDRDNSAAVANDGHGRLERRHDVGRLAPDCLRARSNANVKSINPSRRALAFSREMSCTMVAG